MHVVAGGLGCPSTFAAACETGDEAAPSGRRHRAVERIGRRHRADQDQHDEAHALLAVIRAVGEARRRCRSGSGGRGSTRRRLVALRLCVERRIADDSNFSRNSSTPAADEADQRRQQQCLADLDGLPQSTPRGAVAAAHQRVGHADADDRADQGVRARGRQAELPGAQVPDDRRDQQREHHREAGAAADLQDQFDRQQRDDAERHRAAGDQHAEEIEEARPDHGECGGQRMGVDHGRHRVGGIMKAVDEFEAERDQQRDQQQQIGQVACYLGAGRVDIGVDAVGHEQQRGRDHAHVYDAGQRVKAAVEFRPLAAPARLNRVTRRRSWINSPLTPGCGGLCGKPVTLP